MVFIYKYKYKYYSREREREGSDLYSIIYLFIYFL